LKLRSARLTGRLIVFDTVSSRYGFTTGGTTKKPMTVKRIKATAAPMIHFPNRAMTLSVGVALRCS